MTRSELLLRIATWLEEPAPDDEPCRELTIEHGVSSQPGHTWTVHLHDTGAWFIEHEAWEALTDAGATDLVEPESEWWTGWGAGLTLDEALAAALADLDRADWGRA